MTREEAIKWFIRMKESPFVPLPQGAKEALDMAIEALSAEANLTCKTCADRALCIMSAPDGNWKACKDYRPSAEAEAVREISEECKPLFFGVDYGKLMNKGGDDK